MFTFIEGHVFFEGFYKRKVKTLKLGDNLLKVIITINVRCFNISKEMLGMMEKFIDEVCVKIVCFGKRKSFETLFVNGIEDLHSQPQFYVEKNRKKTTCLKVGTKEAIIFVV